MPSHSIRCVDLSKLSGAELPQMSCQKNRPVYIRGMGKACVILCFCLLGTGCESPPAITGNVSPGEVFFLSTPPPNAARVGWTSFNDHLTWHYPQDAMAHMRQEAAGKGANVVVLRGIDPPNSLGRFGQFEVYGYLATVYVWADLYYFSGLTNSPAQEQPDEQATQFQFASVSMAPSFSPLLAATGAQWQFAPAVGK